MEKALLSAKDEPMLFPKHLPTYIRIHVARNSFPQRPAGLGKPEPRSGSLSAPRPFKDIRKTAVAEAEKQYLKDLIAFTKGDNAKACRISGLSRSRYYTLVRKYRPPKDGDPA
jgi:two-component system NtrC family response regulator